MPPTSSLVVPSGYKPATVELHAFCREHHLTGSESEHDIPYLPHRITIHSELGSVMAEASGWTPEHAATAMLRRLHV